MAISTNFNQLEDHDAPLFMQHLSLEAAKQYYKFCKSTKQMQYWDEFIKQINYIKT